MKSNLKARTITLRLSANTYEQAAALAELRGESLNRLFQAGLLLLAEEERAKRLFDDFSAIGTAESGESDVAFALEAQAEILAGS